MYNISALLCNLVKQSDNIWESTVEFDSFQVNISLLLHFCLLSIFETTPSAHLNTVLNIEKSEHVYQKMDMNMFVNQF